MVGPAPAVAAGSRCPAGRAGRPVRAGRNTPPVSSPDPSGSRRRTRAGMRRRRSTVRVRGRPHVHRSTSPTTGAPPHPAKAAIRSADLKVLKRRSGTADDQTHRRDGCLELWRDTGASAIGCSAVRKRHTSRLISVGGAARLEWRLLGARDREGLRAAHPHRRRTVTHRAGAAGRGGRRMDLRVGVVRGPPEPPTESRPMPETRPCSCSPT